MRPGHFILAALLSLPMCIAAQSGAIDATFNPGDAGNGLGDFANGTVYATLLQPDGKIIIAGALSSYNGTPRKCVARLNADGTLDPSFDPGLGPDVSIRCAALQPDGKIVVGGGFASWNGLPRKRIVRLNPDGTVDPSFNTTGSGLDSWVYCLSVQPDGKLMVGGEFTNYDGIPRNRIARLEANGSLDLSFDPGSGANNYVIAIALQPDGRIILGGGFTAYNGSPMGRIARLNADGSLDPGFTIGSGASNNVYALAHRPNGAILLGGAFTSYNGTSRARICQLNADGTLDTSFDVGTGADSDVNVIVLQPDGRAIIGGGLDTYNGNEVKSLTRLNVDGSVDPNGPGGVGPTWLGVVTTLQIQPDGMLVVGGAFRECGDARPRNIARIDTLGACDTSFNPGSGANATTYILLQPDGKVILYGQLTRYNNETVPYITRAHADGSRDTTFHPPAIDGDLWWEHSPYVTCTALQADGKILIGRNYTLRMNADGTLDSTFNIINTYYAEQFLVQPDGKILVAGNFPVFYPTNGPGVVRFNSDGTLDPSFAAVNTGTVSMPSMRLLPDGKIIIHGAFTAVNGVPRGRIARLNTNGTLDPAFVPGAGANGEITASALQPDGKILLGGSFTTFNGSPRNGLVRLNPDGSVDLSFNPGLGGSGINAIALHPDGKIIVGGSFTTFNGIARSGLVRLHANGGWDHAFNTGPGNGWTPMGGPSTSLGVTSVACQPDGKILIAGSFTNYNGTGRNRVARVNDLPGAIRVSARVFLEGPFLSGTGTMFDNLRLAGLLPAAEPYAGLGYVHTRAGGETVAPAVLSTAGNNAIVDWVLLELRASGATTTIVASRSALLQRDGDVVDLDGTSPVVFDAVNGNYHVAVRHRNHLGAMTLNALPISATTTTVDFTLAGTSTYGTNARKTLGVYQVLWAGDVTFNSQLKYAGSNNDRDPILTAIGGTVPTATLSGQYRKEDINMNALVKYAGTGNDRDVLLQNIGGSVPTATRSAQLP